MPQLYIIRHGRADNEIPDMDRKLTARGKDDVLNVATLLKNKNILIDSVIYSPASRAKQTAMIICDVLNTSPQNQKADDRIYNANVSELLRVLDEIDEQEKSVMLVGHNPGLANLVLQLTEQVIKLSAGNLAIVSADSWRAMCNGKCEFVEKLQANETTF